MTFLIERRVMVCGSFVCGGCAGFYPHYKESVLESLSIVKGAGLYLYFMFFQARTATGNPAHEQGSKPSSPRLCVGFPSSDSSDRFFGCWRAHVRI